MNYVSCNQLENYFRSDSDSDYVVVMNQTEFDNHPDSFYEKDEVTFETIPMVFADGDAYEVIIEDNTFETYLEMDSNFNGRG